MKYLYSVIDSHGILSNSKPVTGTAFSLPKLNNWKISYVILIINLQLTTSLQSQAGKNVVKAS